MQFEVKIDASQVNELIRKMKNLTFKPVMKRIGVYMVNSVQKNFDAQGRPKKWAPLSENYRKWKTKHGFSDRILILTNTLRKSINYKASDFETRVFAGEKYGVYHQTGTRKMPARPFLVIQEEDKTFIKRIIDEYIKQVIE